MKKPDPACAETLTAELVERRLRTLAELSKTAGPPPPLLDMSREAVTARIRESAAISALALELEAAGARARLSGFTARTRRRA